MNRFFYGKHFMTTPPVPVQPPSAMPVSGQAAANLDKLSLIPYPRHVSLKGAALRVTPSAYLYLSASVSPTGRRKCHLLSQLFGELGVRTQLVTVPTLSAHQALFSTAATFQKMPQMERPLRGEMSKPESYRLTVTSEGALLQGIDEQGLLYAGYTLKQLLQDSLNVPGMEIEDSPAVAMRVIHLDFKGWPPTFAYLKHTIAQLASVKINGLVLDYESYFNFLSQPGLASEGALSPEQVAELDLFAQDVGVMLIPLVPCLGNVAHVLKHPAYHYLREHPNYTQQFCPVNPATFDIVTTMMEDLISVHSGRYFHIGGDEIRLLGVHPQSAARVQQLGGRSALYLEYVGKVCRYLIARQKLPLVWDEMFRKMSDDQLKWLPPEVTLTFAQYDGQGGRATPAILTHLDRYRRVGRRVWGAAARLPSKKYDSFDNIDAWTEASEFGYVEGLITTTWTRQHHHGPLYAPPETVWASAFYAAERKWSGLHHPGHVSGPAREQFPNRFVTRMFGVKEPANVARLWGGVDALQRNYSRRICDCFSYDHLAATEQPNTTLRNTETLSFWKIWTALGSFKEYVDQFEEYVNGNYANLLAGKGDAFHCGRLRFRIMDAKQRLPSLAQAFSQRAAHLTVPAVIQEYLDSELSYQMKRLDEMEGLLARYPMPEVELQQPLNL
jgi:hypothetical protein